MSQKESHSTPRLGNLWESIKLQEATVEQIDATKDSMERSKDIAQKHYGIEEKERSQYASFFNKNLDGIWSWVVDIQDDAPLSLSDVREKEKVEQYAKLANLAYARFERVEKTGATSLSNLKVKEASLDIASIDFTKFDIDSDGKLRIPTATNTTPDEEFIVSYFNSSNLYGEQNRGAADSNDRNIHDIIDVALFKSGQDLAALAKQRASPIRIADAGAVSSDAGGWYDVTGNRIAESEQRLQQLGQFIETNRPKLQDALIRLKESKTQEYSSQFEEFQKQGDFKILAYYPEESSHDTSGFQCVLFEKDGKKVLSIAGTQLTDIWDLHSNFAILRGKIPEAQTKKMIDFFRNHLSANEDIAIVGHSLGGTLAQIGSSMYSSSETYTFNAPWAKELEVSTPADDPYQKELQDFTKNRTSATVGEKVVNVKWSRWLSFIAEKGVDIWNYRIDVDTSSHSIEAILKAIEKVKVLTRRRVNETRRIY